MRNDILKYYIEVPDNLFALLSITQLYFGAFSATELWEAGRIKCSDVRKLQLLDELFPKCRTYNNEYF